MLKRYVFCFEHDNTNHAVKMTKTKNICRFIRLNLRIMKCLNCNETLEGRIDKKYCSDYCKSNYHYEKNKKKEDSFFKQVDKQLKLNRRSLKNFNLSGKSTVRKEKIIQAGFNPNIFTHYWKNQKGDVYLFCYEYGFLRRTENGKDKYVLVEWQDYMKSPLQSISTPN